MITLVSEVGVDPSFLTTRDVEGLTQEIPAQSQRVDELMDVLEGKMGAGEAVPWSDVENPVYADSSTGAVGLAKIDSLTSSQSQTTAASVYAAKKLLAQTKALPTVKINGKALTADVTLTLSDFNMYTAAEIDAKLGPADPTGPYIFFNTEEAEEVTGTQAAQNPDDASGNSGVLTNLRYVNGEWVGTYTPMKFLIQAGQALNIIRR